MHANKRYHQMVFYWETCESGSMFEHLNSSINVFATTASSPTQSSYACYLDKELKTFVGDCYSVHWMEGANLNLRDYGRI